MITSTELYWITRLDTLCDVLKTFSIVSGWVGLPFLLGICIAGVCSVIDPSDGEGVLICSSITKSCKRAFIYCLVVFSTSMLVRVVVPTTAEMAMIKVIPALANSDFIQKDLPSEAKELYVLAKQALEQHVRKGK